MDEDDESVPVWANRYPPAAISPAQYEQFVGDLLRAGGTNLENMRVAEHETIKGVDGTYDFDATVRFRFLDVDFLVVVEAKRYANPVKRDVVQILHAKVQSVGAHKAVLISTAPFQRGALRYAETHGIALVTVTEGRFSIETRAAGPAPLLTREQARELYDVPTFVGVYLGAGDTPGSTMSAIIGTDTPGRVRELLYGLPSEPE